MRELWRTFTSPRMLVCLTTGFSSGLPLYVLIQLIPAWMTERGVDLTTVGLASLMTAAYTYKFLWAPLMDRITPSRMGRRRGWAFLTQVALMLSIASLSLVDPVESVSTVMFIGVIIGFTSASQDITLDALRREILPDEELGLGTSLFVNAYRLSSLVPGSLALILADILPWSQVHLVVAAFVSVGLVTTLLIDEPANTVPPPKTFREAVVDPFRTFFTSRGVAKALGVLLFMLLYKLGDSMATALSTPFYLELGFTMTQIGTVAKVAALWSSLAGGFLGGVIMVKVGINRALWLFGVVQLLSILGFAALAERGPDMNWLFWVVSFEYLGVGLGTAAFVAFIARATDKRYTATQLALLTSLTSLPRMVAGASTGFIVEAVGFTMFFILCAGIAIPGMLMLPWVAPWNAPEPTPEPEAEAT